MSAEIAARIEAANRGWVVFWGAWRRTYTAWALWTFEQVSVETRDPYDLVALMRRAEHLHRSDRIGT